MSGKVHEGQFLPRRLNARCRFGQGTLAGTGGKEEDAPIPAIRAIEIRPPNSIWPPGGLVRDERPCRGTA